MIESSSIIRIDSEVYNILIADTRSASEVLEEKLGMPPKPKPKEVTAWYTIRISKRVMVELNKIKKDFKLSTPNGAIRHVLQLQIRERKSLY